MSTDAENSAIDGENIMSIPNTIPIMLSTSEKM